MSRAQLWLLVLHTIQSQLSIICLPLFFLLKSYKILQVFAHPSFKKVHLGKPKNVLKNSNCIFYNKFKNFSKFLLRVSCIFKELLGFHPSTEVPYPEVAKESHKEARSVGLFEALLGRGIDMGGRAIKTGMGMGGQVIRTGVDMGNRALTSISKEFKGLLLHK